MHGSALHRLHCTVQHCTDFTARCSTAQTSLHSSLNILASEGVYLQGRRLSTSAGVHLHERVASTRLFALVAQLNHGCPYATLYDFGSGNSSSEFGSPAPGRGLEALALIGPGYREGGVAGPPGEHLWVVGWVVDARVPTRVTPVVPMGYLGGSVSMGASSVVRSSLPAAVASRAL